MWVERDRTFFLLVSSQNIGIEFLPYLLLVLLSAEVQISQPR